MKAARNSHTIVIADGAAPKIAWNIFHDNILIDITDKAVITCWGNDIFATITRNIFYGNGGICCIWVQEGDVEINNNVFDGNRGALLGGSGFGIVKNNIVVNSSGTAMDGGFQEVDYNDVWNNVIDYG